MTINMPEPWRRNVPQRLVTEFGVTEGELCDEVMTRAQAAARAYEGNLFPRGGVGQVRHLHLVRNLSMLLQPRGYKRRDDDNVARLVNAERGIALIVTSGNAATGVPKFLARRDPSTKYAKGPATHAAVQRNGQLAFNITGQEDEDVDLDAYVTWFLMVYVDKLQIRGEVSCPNGVNTRGFVTQWSDRLLLQSLPNDGSAVDIDFGPEDDDGESGIDVPIEPR